MPETEVIKEKTANTGPVATDHEQNLARAALTGFSFILLLLFNPTFFKQILLKRTTLQL